MSKQRTRQVKPFKQVVEDRGLKYTPTREAALRGEIPYFKFGRAWYVDEAEIDAFIERARVDVDGDGPDNLEDTAEAAKKKRRRVA